MRRQALTRGTVVPVAREREPGMGNRAHLYALANELIILWP
jgi:hypothetical protein